MKNKFVSYLLVLLLFASFCLILIKRFDIVKADSGWDTDYDSGGSWDSSSDYDYGWDSDSSSDFGYDSNYNSSNSNQLGSITNDSLYYFAFFIVILLIVVIIVRTCVFPRKTSQIETKNIKKYDKRYMPISVDKAQKLILNFNVEEFNYKAFKIFYDVQFAWMNFDYEKLKELLTDELYNSYVMQLEALKLKNHKNVMKEFELIDSHIFELKEENGLYIAKVYLDVKFYDYIQSTKNEMIIRGSAYNKLNNTYILTFVSSKEKAVSISKCPRCGANATGNVTGICEFCNSKSINKSYDWVISKKEKINQR